MTTAIPGDFLAVVEEFEPGFGTFQEDGKVYAAIPGHAKTENHLAQVQNPDAVQHLKKGDLVYAIVRDVYDQIALLEFQPVKFRAATNTYAYIRISHVAKGYTENFRDVFRIGDYVRARVHEVRPLGLYLSMVEPDLGVVRAFCASCREELALKSSEIRCRACGRRQGRKIAVKRD
ncbi:MAG: exosome complex RNA-binding protein Csl4 [Candidatus Micrarchaeota archaeon]|nr:exosome complex RNA-binding protein Csl4 [Candidatus Micrarchaeota archaeon]